MYGFLHLAPCFQDPSKRSMGQYCIPFCGWVMLIVFIYLFWIFFFNRRKCHTSTSRVVKMNPHVPITQIQPLSSHCHHYFIYGLSPRPYCPTEHSRHHMLLPAHRSVTVCSTGRLPKIRVTALGENRQSSALTSTLRQHPICLSLLTSLLRGPQGLISGLGTRARLVVG